MDDKLSQVLGNKELMEKIADLVRGGTESPPPAPLAPPAVTALAAKEPAVPALSPTASRGLALLDALAPFLKEERRKKLAAARGAITVAGAYKNIKKL